MNPRLTALTVTILTVAATRLLPHPPNFTPVAAIALFGGAHFADRRTAFLVPVAAMFLSDLALGLHRLLPLVYLCFALTVCMGFLIRRQRKAGAIVIGTIASALVFYAATNFAVWAGGTMYPHDTAGLAACYTAALPFLKNMVLGNLFYAALLFGGFALAESKFPVLREPVAAPAAS